MDGYNYIDLNQIFCAIEEEALEESQYVEIFDEAQKKLILVHEGFEDLVNE